MPLVSVQRGGPRKREPTLLLRFLIHFPILIVNETLTAVHLIEEKFPGCLLIAEWLRANRSPGAELQEFPAKRCV